MSEWNEVESDNVSLEHEQKEVHLWIKQNNFGSVYGTLTFDQIDQIHKEIHTNDTKEEG